jgi:asparagine synthase (glutamine-hydrolysing)
MICGAYRTSGGSARELAVLPRLERAGGDAAVTIRGPLAVVSGGPEVTMAEVDGITCILDGFLHDRTTLTSQQGVHGADDDADLVARAYGRDGLDLLPRLRGRFSLIVWDERRRRGWLTADLLATRPLYTRTVPDATVFATELCELLPLLPTRPGPDPVAFPSWLISGICPEGRTLYDGVARLGPGELVALASGTVRRQTYWRPQFSGVRQASRADLVAGLRERILRSTGRRQAPDFTGVILSGGLDSSLVTAAAHVTRRSGMALRTYSAVFPGAPYDESDKIRELTESLRIDARTFEIAPQGTLWEALRYAARWQVPLAGINTIVDLAATAAAAADGVSVLMDGQTGDEILGFAPYLLADRLRAGRLRSALALIDRWPGHPPTKLHQKLWLLREIGLKGAAPYGLGQTVRRRRAGQDSGPPWLLPHLRAQRAELEDRWAWKVRHPGALWWRQLADVHVYAPHREQRLDYLRHRSAAVGVVGESPLYDVDLIQYALSLPPELGFDPRFDRSLAREAATGLMPEAVRLQPRKADFGPFAHAAVTGADAPGLERLLTAPNAELGAYVDLDWVRRTWHRLRAARFGEVPGLSMMWRLASAEGWLRLQSAPGFADELLANPGEAPPMTTTVAAGT